MFIESDKMANSGIEGSYLDETLTSEFEHALETSKIGEWQLERRLGSGAYGVAYFATKTRYVGSKEIKIPGAVKLVASEGDLPSLEIRAIVDELSKLSKLQSRYIANLIDAGTYETDSKVILPFFAMDYINGENLFQILKTIKKEKLPMMQPETFKNLALSMLKALLAAHDAKILHLDIKPKNIMFSSNDATFVLIDFGISKFIENDILDGFYGGTPGYIAPEVFIQKASNASDVYSLGLTLYEALTLENPFLKAAKELFKQNPNENPRSTKFIQTATNNIKLDLNRVSADQGALIKSMVESDPKKRLSIEQLIKLANELIVPTKNSPEISQSGIASEIYQSWEKMYLYIVELITTTGLGKAKIVIDDSSHYRLWFRTEITDQGVAIFCPTQKNSISLSKLGWKPDTDGKTYKKIVSPNAEAISDTIIKAMKIGLALQPPVTVTLGQTA